MILTLDLYLSDKLRKYELVPSDYRYISSRKISKVCIDSSKIIFYNLQDPIEDWLIEKGNKVMFQSVVIMPIPIVENHNIFFSKLTTLDIKKLIQNEDIPFNLSDIKT